MTGLPSFTFLKLGRDAVNDEPKILGVNRLVGDFLRASAPLETYLQQRGPLSNLHVQSIELSLNCLQHFLKAWKKDAIE